MTRPPLWSAAVVPAAPVLEPELGGDAAVGPLRSACAAAVYALVSGRRSGGPRTVVCVGAGDRTRRHDPHAWGTLAGYGVAVEGPTRHAGTPATLPPSLTIGRRLLERAGWHGPVVLQEVAATASTAQCLSVGVELPTASTVWLVLGDGSASPDGRARQFDTAAARALDGGRPSGLLELESGLAAELGASGRPAWQTLAAAASSAARIETDLLYDDAPYGVGYLVARWDMYADAPVTARV